MALNVVVLSGLSGSGKTTALHALEDAGYFCVDNLPLQLLDTFLRLVDDNPSIDRVALAMDVRERLFDPAPGRDLSAISAGHYQGRILFLDCADDVLLARFKTTRRRHPLIAQGAATTLVEATTLERTWLEPIRAAASAVIDTSDLTVHELKRRVQNLYGDPGATALAVHLMSFGFRHGVPQEADFVFDVRFLDNPYFVESLRDRRGLDPEVADFVLSQPAAVRFREHVVALLSDVLPQVEAEGRASVTIAVGCTGGHHRSVAMCETLRDALAEGGRPALLSHRDIHR